MNCRTDDITSGTSEARSNFKDGVWEEGKGTRWIGSFGVLFCFASVCGADKWTRASTMLGDFAATECWMTNFKAPCLRLISNSQVDVYPESKILQRINL